MNWSDRALVLGARPHGEAALVVELMTREHGRHLGLVHGGRSRRLLPAIQPGNTVAATWRARLDDQLGTATIEPDLLRAGRLLASSLALAGLAALAAHLRLLPERDPHPALFDLATLLADHLDEPRVVPALFVRFEIALLAELGFGLDLERCAATGATRDLAFVSPRTGRAVGRGPGEPWRDRLLPLPAFLTGRGAAVPGAAEIEAGFALSGFFLQRSVYDAGHGRAGTERGRFVALALDAARAASPPVSGMFPDPAAPPSDSPPDETR